MKERVELNDNGLSIESSCHVFYRIRWQKRYIVCRKQKDLGNPLFIIYKSRADRLKDKIKQSIILSDFVGTERSFSLKNKFNTLALVTKEHIIDIAFETAENLVQWETWFKTICGQCATNYMVLLKFPRQEGCLHMLGREVRCLLHLQDSRLALVYGLPQKILLYGDVGAIIVKINMENHTVTVRSHAAPDEEFVLSCATIDLFNVMLEKAKQERWDLHQYLCNQTEGTWISNTPMNVKKNDSLSRLSDSQSNFSNFGTPQATTLYMDNVSSRNVAPSSNLQNITNILNINEPLPRKKSFDERSDYMNISRQSSTKRSNANLRSSSLPEYVNVHCAVKPNGSIRSSHSFFNVASTSAAEEPKRRKVSDYAPQTDSSRRRSDNSVGRFLNRTRNFVYNKNRSMMDFTTIRDEEQDSRYESWRRAKRFISAFSPKSQSELRNGKVYQVITKSSSTGALQYATTLLRKNTNAGETTNSMSEIYELPPALNVAVTDPLSLSALKESRSSEDTPVGLVRVKEDNQLKARGGVNIMLARRLASSVRGSFSKYDGERVTHHYPSKVGGEGTKDENAAATPTTPTKRGPLEVKILTETKPLEESEPMDAIAVSVSRKQEELRAQDRRASTVSFHKTHVFPVHPPSSTSHPEKEKSPPSMRSKAAAAARTILSHLKGAATRNSNAFSESTRSSAESLSSDARSKISIKKRSSSPPSQMAPTISRNTSRHTLVQEPSTSTDSLSSERTARSITSPQLVLPMKTSHASSSGSSTESNSASEDGSPKVRQSTSVASSLNESRNLYLSGFSPSRRFSQGQCSMTSGNTTPQTQGYFRKHRRLRRSQRTLESSSSQPNLA